MNEGRVNSESIQTHLILLITLGQLLQSRQSITSAEYAMSISNQVGQKNDMSVAWVLSNPSIATFQLSLFFSEKNTEISKYLR